MGETFSSVFSPFAQAFDGLAEFISSLFQHLAVFLATVNDCRNTSYPIGVTFQSVLETPSDPLFEKYLSLNSSQHLDYHYAAVRDSLTPVQLTGFDQSLQTTIGGDGTVVFGGVGVVALALAILFDLLATQAKGQALSPDPIKQIFHGEGEALENMSNAISDCLCRLPKSGTDKEKMMFETKLCSYQLKSAIHNYTTDVLDRAQATGQRVNDMERIHLVNAHLFYLHLGIHQYRVYRNDDMKTFFPIYEEQEQIPLFRVLAPNVSLISQTEDESTFVSRLNFTNGMQYWSNSEREQFCFLPKTTFLAFYFDQSQNAYSSSMTEIDKLGKQDENFVAFKS